MENKNTLHIEQSIVGYFLKVPALFSDLVNKPNFKIKFNSELFSDELCSTIIQIYTIGFNKGVVFDRLLLINELEGKNILGWRADLDILVMRAAEASKVEYYIDALFKNHQLKQLSRIAKNIELQINQGSYNFDIDPQKIIDSVQKDIHAFNSTSSLAPSFENMKDSSVKFIDLLQKKTEGNNYKYGISTGFDNLDKVIGGWYPQELVIREGHL